LIMTNSEYICHLRKAIYSLKQPPHCWFQHFNAYLTSFGFICSKANTSSFFYHSHGALILLLLHVDDILVTRNNDHLLQKLISTLYQKFVMKDLGSLHYFLGVAATRTNQGLFPSQVKLSY